MEKVLITIVVVISLAAIALIAGIPNQEASAKECGRTDLQLPPTQPILVSLVTSAEKRLSDTGDTLYDISFELVKKCCKHRC